MIRTACIALAAATLSLTAQSASATTNLNGRISQIVNGLHKNAHFSLRDMSLTINAGTPTRIFTGIEGIRALNGTDFATLNDWADQQPVPGNAFNGGGYTFTHNVLGSFFNSGGIGGQPAPDNGFNGAPYQFTHEVLDSYFDDADPAPQGASRMMLIEAPRMLAPAVAPVPEPASWAMMIGGFALVGGALRRRRVAVRLV